MSGTVAIIDYGSGNLRSAAKAFERSVRALRTDAEIVVSNDPDVVRKADRIVLPGVGAFEDCMNGLNAVRGMRQAMEERVIQGGAPFLGICVGMQLMATEGHEKGIWPGLNWIFGPVVRLEPRGSLKVPHMGWNTLKFTRPHKLLEGIPDGDEGLHAYFVHSYHLAPSDDRELFATADYGQVVTACVGRDNMFGTQFHPEKEPDPRADADREFPGVAAVILFPAIDLKGGEVVRLKLGDMDAATVFNTDPAAQARAFEAQGFAYLHVVDLDGAFAGESRNGAAVEAILRAVAMPVQLGGGIRSLAQIAAWLEKGVRRVILGTVALRDPALVKTAAEQFPGRIAVGIDARGGKVAVEGWAATSELSALELAKRFEGAGVAAVIYTDIDRDGVLAGINWDATLQLARAVSIPIIASGGLASMADIERLARPECQILEGAITGRALYDGRIDAGAALAMLRGVAA